MKKFTLLVVAFLMAAALVQAQVERNMVAVEIGTGTWCQYCPGAALGADDLVANGCRVAVIENHNGDTYANTFSDARNTYYGISGYPTAFFDGVLSVVGGNHTQSMYTSYLPKYNTRIAVLSPLTIDYTVTRTGQLFDFVFTITKVAALPNNQLVFQFTVTQSEISQSWQGQTHLNFVDRIMVPDQNGTPLDFSSTDVQTVNISVTIDPMWPMEDIEFVAFVQNNSGKEIQNTIRPVMSDFEATTSTDICQHNSISFADNSIGRPGSVSWLFPGGSPASSTSESPSVVYHTPGVYDVTLITKTGLTVDTVTKEDYVNIRPGALVSDPTGLTLVCTNNLGQTTDYTTASTTASSFEWQLYPTSAGTVVNNGATCTIQWVHNWYGTASIRVRGSNDCGYGDWTQYMDISCTSCVEVEENPQQAVTVYPNPASKEMNLTLNTSNQQVAVKLINALGKVVYEEKVNTAKHSINVSRIPAGMYFLAVEGNNLNYTQKVTIQH